MKVLKLQSQKAFGINEDLLWLQAAAVMSKEAVAQLRSTLYIYFFSNCSTVSLSCTMSEAGLLLPLTFKKDPSLFAHSHSNIFFLLFSQELLLLVAFLQTHAPDSKEKTLLFRSKNPLQTTFSITSFLRLLHLKIATPSC